MSSIKFVVSVVSADEGNGEGGGDGGGDGNDLSPCLSILSLNRLLVSLVLSTSKSVS
jgi:hypothetical protein